MSLLQMELTELEVEPLEVVEFSRPEQNSTLETLTSSKEEVDSTGVLILKGTLPRNDVCFCCGGPPPGRPAGPPPGAPPACCCCDKQHPVPCFCDAAHCCGCCPNQCYCC